MIYFLLIHTFVHDELSNTEATRVSRIEHFLSVGSVGMCVAESRADCEKAVWGIPAVDPQRQAAPTMGKPRRGNRWLTYGLKSATPLAAR